MEEKKKNVIFPPQPQTVNGISTLCPCCKTEMASSSHPVSLSGDLSVFTQIAIKHRKG